MAILRVRVTPRASKSEVTGYRDGTLRVRLTAPPVEGKANRELLKLLADWLGVRKGDLGIVSGEKTRDKAIEIEGLSDGDLKSLLAQARQGLEA
jgi:uncharacterized protein (TIGR00251 family)